MNNNWNDLVVQNTDQADPVTVLATVLHCAESWEPNARIIGNVRAGDIARSIRILDPLVFDALCDPDHSIKNCETGSWQMVALAQSRKLHAVLSVPGVKETLKQLKWSNTNHHEKPYMVGEYYADYSELTKEELAACDAQSDALIARSKVVSEKKI